MTEALTTKLDKLNELIREIEDALVAAGYIADASISLDHHRLAWKKNGGTWKLLLVAANGEEQELTKASVRKRIDGVNNLPKLLEALDGALVEREGVIDGAINVAIVVLAQLGMKGKNCDESV